MKKPTVLKNEPKADAVGGRTRAREKKRRGKNAEKNAEGHISTNNEEVDVRRSFSDWTRGGETAEKKRRGSHLNKQRRG
jgi:hypothetical protein